MGYLQYPTHATEDIISGDDWDTNMVGNRGWLQSPPSGRLGVANNYTYNSNDIIAYSTVGIGGWLNGGVTLSATGEMMPNTAGVYVCSAGIFCYTPTIIAAQWQFSLMANIGGVAYCIAQSIGNSTYSYWVSVGNVANLGETDYIYALMNLNGGAPNVTIFGNGNPQTYIAMAWKANV